jgi:hypothetical protein
MNEEVVSELGESESVAVGEELLNVCWGCPIGPCTFWDDPPDCKNPITGEPAKWVKFQPLIEPTAKKLAFPTKDTKESIRELFEELLKEVLEWWDEHEFDCCGSSEDEYNVYDENPDMVVVAKKLKKLLEE